MATYYSVATGNWASVSTWSASSGGAPGVGPPVSGDTATIEGGFTVIVAATTTAYAKLADIDGGVLAIGAGATLVIDDAAGALAGGAHIVIETDGGLDSAGTATSRATIRSASTVPTYPIKMLIYDVSPDTRTMDFSYLSLEGFAIFIGNDTTYHFFNTGTASDGFITEATVLTREPILASYPIDGRIRDRVVKKGNHAGVMRASGILAWDSYTHHLLEALAESTTPVAFVSPYQTLTRGRVEAFSPGRSTGVYLPFTITLLEDL